MQHALLILLHRLHQATWVGNPSAASISTTSLPPPYFTATQVLQRAQLKRQMLGPRPRQGGGQDATLDMFRSGRGSWTI